MNERKVELDVLKAFAIVGVILIHVVSTSLFYFDKSSDHFKVSILVDQFFRFSVPLFVALSGYTLAVRYKGQKMELSYFFRRRVARILPWYFFWSVVILVYLKVTHWWNEVPHFPLWKIIFLGKADYHLYFVAMIFQLYLLFPLLLFLFKKFSIKFLLFLLFFEVIFYQILSSFSVGKIDLPVLLNDQQQYLFFGTWIFPFVLGITLANIKIPQNALKLSKILSIPVIAVSFIWLFKSVFDILQGGFGVIIATRSTKIPTLFYSSVFIIYFIIFKDSVLKFPKKLISILENFGKRSYVTYLCHTIILRIFLDLITPNTFPKLALLSVMTVIASDSLSQVSNKTADYIHKFANSKLTRKVN